MGEDKISIYGYSFSIKIITSVLTDRAFCTKIFDILKPDYFDNDSMQWIIKNTFSYYLEYKTVPSLDVFKEKLEQETDDVIKREIAKCLRDAYNYVDSDDLTYVKDATLKFCKDRELKNAILESADLLKFSKYDEIKNIIDKALQKGLDTNIGLEYEINVERRYAENKRNPIPTGWDVIDELTKGGLGPGELGIVAAGPGLGKSWLLTSIGANAMKLGKTVIHYTLELNEDYVGLRYDAIVTGISLDNLEYNVATVKEKIKKLPGRLIVKWYPTKSASLITLKAHLDKIIMLGQKPDMIIIDYADLLKSTSRSKERHEQLENLYEEIRGLAGEYWVPVWSASQIGRSGSGDDTVEGDKIAGSFAKLFVADFAMTLSRKTKDKMALTGRGLVIKNRFGADGVMLPMKIDTSMGKFEFFSDQSGIGAELKSAMKTDSEFDKSYLVNKYANFKNKMANPTPNASKDDDYF
jgi:replicative DNA helicase